MSEARRIRGKILAICLCAAILVIAGAAIITKAYIPTNRDTRTAPDKVTYELVKTDSYELLYESGTLRYYYREDRDIFAIEDKRNGYTWKTGIDRPFSKTVKKALKKAETEEEKLAIAEPLEQGMNTTYLGIANSLITVEYYENDTIKNISSASEEDAESALYTLNDNPATRRLDISFTKIDLKLSVYITFSENSIHYDIPFDEITGEGKLTMAAVLISPFLGASGGAEQVYDAAEQDYGDTEAKYMIPGYVLLPDGSGSLVRFNDNTAAFTEYVGDVYGEDPSAATYNYDYANDVVPLKNPLMPVYGIAHGDSQAAFAAYADSGAEFMEIICRPEENTRVLYTWAYPRFKYNTTYYQIYNRSGTGYFKLMDKPNEFDISMTYTFLSGDGSDGTPAADYTGMARVYREHLIEQGVLSEINSNSESSDIPIRLDFLMADSKKGIVASEEVVVTTTEDVDEILADVRAKGIANINSGLLGWQEDGETLTKPYKQSYSSAIGRKAAFTELFRKYAELGVDISYSRNYLRINREMLSFYDTAAQHMNTWYTELNYSYVYPENSIVYEFGYAKPELAAEWMIELAEDVSEYSKSYTVSGITNTLVSTYEQSGCETNVTQAIELYQNAMAGVGENMKLNLDSPNMYLWKYTDRFLQMPVGGSQYIFETDSVPFLQMVLYGTMELYAPYSNFSFYSQEDILRMIDYNISPSFILTEKPSYLLADTISADMYSTEYTQYEELIEKIYNGVNSVLRETSGCSWTARRVPAEGIAINTYKNIEGAVTEVVINYTEEGYTYKGTVIPAESACIVR